MTQSACHVLSIFRCLQVSNFASTLTKMIPRLRSPSMLQVLLLAQPPEAVQAPSLPCERRRRPSGSRCSFRYLDRRDRPLKPRAKLLPRLPKLAGHVLVEQRRLRCPYQLRRSCHCTIFCSGCRKNCDSHNRRCQARPQLDHTKIIVAKSFRPRTDRLGATPLWVATNPTRLRKSMDKAAKGFAKLYSGFEIWIDWYQDRFGRQALRLGD